VQIQPDGGWIEYPYRADANCVRHGPGVGAGLGDTFTVAAGAAVQAAKATTDARITARLTRASS
jgi:hypothetical protein